MTYVVYSNGIQNTETVLETGINEYSVKAISMIDKDGDVVIQEIQEKIYDNIKVTKQDLIALTFTPIMSGKLTKLEKIIKSIRLVKKTDTAIKAIKMGFDNEAISNLTGLTEKEINLLRRVQSN